MGDSKMETGAGRQLGVVWCWEGGREGGASILAHRAHIHRSARKHMHLSELQSLISE